jgi:hypothetical protein
LLRLRLGDQQASNRDQNQCPQEGLHDRIMVRVRTLTVCTGHSKFVRICYPPARSLQTVSAPCFRVVNLCPYG